MLYNNTEAYVQDNWKVNSRLTLDCGRPLHAPAAAVPTSSSRCRTSSPTVERVRGAGPLRRRLQQRRGRLLRQHQERDEPDHRADPDGPGSPNTQAAIGTPVPGIGNPLNGIRQAGDGISKYGYTWPKIVVGPRFGVAYDMTGNQSLIFRGGGGIFYDRPDGNTVFSIPGNPPIATSIDLRTGQLQNLSTGPELPAGPGHEIFQYDAKVPASAQWEAGVQKTLPWASVVDVSYVGNHGYNRLGAFQNGNDVNLNAVDFGAAYLPQNQDPTLGPQTVPGAGAYSTNLMRAYRGLGNINSETTEFQDTYHSIQSNFNRRFRNGFSFGVNHTLSLSFNGNTGLTKRLQHNADGTISVRDDQAEYEELNKQLNLQRHLAQGQLGVEPAESPDRQRGDESRRRGRQRLAALRALQPHVRQPVRSGLQLQHRRWRGEPDRLARLRRPHRLQRRDRRRLLEQPVQAVRHLRVAGPTYGSVGLESGRNVLIGCPIFRTDLAIARNIRFGGARQLQLRVDAFNLFNQAQITGRNNSGPRTTARPIRPSDNLTVPGGWHGRSDRLQPRNAGFGAAKPGRQPDQRQLPARDPVHHPNPVLEPRTALADNEKRVGDAPTRFFCAGSALATPLEDREVLARQLVVRAQLECPFDVLQPFVQLPGVHERTAKVAVHVG